MSRWKGILLAAAPLTALLVFAGGARLIPSVFGKADAEAEDRLQTIAQKTPPAKNQGGKRAPVAPPKKADTKTQAALQKVVGGQLAAIRKDDFAAAIRYSTPQFRQSFTPESFRQMLKSGYAGLLSYKSLRFEPARLSAGVAMMPVFLKSESGGETGYLYILRSGSDAAGTPVKPKKGEKLASSANWYVETVSAIGGRYLGGEDGPGPGPGPVTNIREI